MQKEFCIKSNLWEKAQWVKRKKFRFKNKVVICYDNQNDLTLRLMVLLKKIIWLN